MCNLLCLFWPESLRGQLSNNAKILYIYKLYTEKEGNERDFFCEIRALRCNSRNNKEKGDVITAGEKSLYRANFAG